MVFVNRILLIGALLVLSTGCVERKLFIRSDPPGAEVALNRADALPGTTPLEVEFDDYGTYHVRAELEDYQELTTSVDVPTPWWGWFPLDFVTDVLLPFSIEDHHYVDLTLEPLPPLRTIEELRARHAEVIERGEALREQVNEGDPAEAR